MIEPPWWTDCHEANRNLCCLLSSLTSLHNSLSLRWCSSFPSGSPLIPPMSRNQLAISCWACLCAECTYCRIGRTLSLIAHTLHNPLLKISWLWACRLIGHVYEWLFWNSGYYWVAQVTSSVHLCTVWRYLCITMALYWKKVGISLIYLVTSNLLHSPL